MNKSQINYSRGKSSEASMINTRKARKKSKYQYQGFEKQ